MNEEIPTTKEEEKPKTWTEQIMSIKKERLIVWILCFLFLFVGLFFILGSRDARECVGNPFIYGASKITNEDTGTLLCTCSFGSPDYANFYFDEDSLEIMRG